MNGGNMKKLTLISLIISFFSLSVNAAPLQSLGEGEGELNVVAWAGYLERGETMEAFDWVTGYENNTCLLYTSPSPRD